MNWNGAFNNGVLPGNGSPKADAVQNAERSTETSREEAQKTSQNSDAHTHAARPAVLAPPATCVALRCARERESRRAPAAAPPDPGGTGLPALRGGGGGSQLMRP